MTNQEAIYAKEQSMKISEVIANLENYLGTPENVARDGGGKPDRLAGEFENMKRSEVKGYLAALRAVQDGDLKK